MPTIDELPPAFSVSDTDEIAVSQSDITRSATRAQFLAGVQPALALPPGAVLGRVSAGIGTPETIPLGANLAIVNGSLTAPPPFVISALAAGTQPMPNDLVPISQGNQNASISYAALLGGLSGASGIDVSNLTVSATGAGVTRRLGDIFADALSVESFGAVGDGVTDDTAAFAAAVGSGHPIRLDGRIYIVNGPLLIAGTSAVLGVAGATVIRRLLLTSSTSWITIASSSLDMEGVTFDANRLGGADAPVVAVTPTCIQASFVACNFENAMGSNAGCGLNIVSVAGASHQLEQCGFNGNSVHGVDVSGGCSIVVSGCTATTNGSAGIRIEAGTACVVRDNVCTANSVGISVGGWEAGPAAQQGGPVCAVIGNLSSMNAIWGVAVAGVGATIDGNTTQNNGSTALGGGILARIGASRLTGNLSSGGSVGIDARGCWGSSIADNHVSDATTGLSVGGSQNLTASENTLLTNGWGILATAIEPSLSTLPTGPISISRNWIGFTTAQSGGIKVLDAAQGVAVTGNDINGWGSALIDQALWLHTDAAIVLGNRWNNQARFTVQANPVAGLEALVVPDVADEVLVTSAPAPVASIMTAHQADTLGQICFIKVTSGGAGYTQAHVAVAGSGAGAAGTAIINDGQLVWIVVTNQGSGYGSIGATAQVTITGDGSGAAANAYVGLPVMEARRLRVVCNTQMQLALTASSPAQQSWTGCASTIPANGVLDMEGVFGSWRAVSFPPVDYLAPTGDGGAILQSIGTGSLVLRPGSGGNLHLANANEATGCTSSVGRGSPLGAVAAPPGSDFRNLNGGPGSTFWVKQENSDATGWVAIG